MGSFLDNWYANMPCPSIIACIGTVVFAVKISDHSRLLLNSSESDLLHPAS